MEIIPDKRKVVGLIEHAHEGKICLPNFQRDFVWTREEVADLVRSIIRGYFTRLDLGFGHQTLDRLTQPYDDRRAHSATRASPDRR